MCDDLTGIQRSTRDAASAEALQQISRALGVPASTFYELRTATGADADLGAAEGASLLELVRVHLSRVPAEKRRVFVEAVERIASGP